MRRLLFVLLLFFTLLPVGSFPSGVYPTEAIQDITYRSSYTIYSAIEYKETHELSFIQCRASIDRVQNREAWGTTAGHCVKDDEVYKVKYTYIMYNDGWRKIIYVTKIYSDIDQADFYIPDIGATAYTGTRPPVQGEAIFVYGKDLNQEYFNPSISKTLWQGFVGPEVKIFEEGEGDILFIVRMTFLPFLQGMSGGGVYAVSDGRRVGTIVARIVGKNGKFVGFFTPVR